MSGLDYGLAPIALREQLSFTRGQVTQLDRAVAAMDGVAGAVLLSTCNRTELYIVCGEDQAPDPGALLCAGAGVEYARFSAAFVTRRDEDCVRHLMEVACGVRSQIWGDDQILTQVKEAVALARAAGTAGPVLETLFRTAAACGKTVKTGVQLTNLPASAAHQTVAALEAKLGSLAGKKALVIGNGEMGRLAAGLLRDGGCAVTVTLRTYRHGETVVPAGCAVTPYDRRYEAMEGMDLLLSATASPHCVVTAQGLEGVAHPPKVLVDLAIPRDIQPEVGEREGFTLLNMDAMGRVAGEGTEPEQLARCAAIIQEHMARFRRWMTYKDGIPAMERLKETVTRRVVAGLEDGMEPEEAAEYAARRTVELLAGSLSRGLTAQELEECAEKIRIHTR
jgi:glutamyl-tRNA reductase